MRTHISLVLGPLDHVAVERQPAEDDDPDDWMIVTFDEGSTIAGDRQEVVRWVEEMYLKVSNA